MQYWLSHGDENTYGPYPIEELRRFAAEGLIGPQTRFRTENSETWIPADRLVALPNQYSPAAAPASVPSPFVRMPTDSTSSDPLFLNISNERLVLMNIASLGLYEAYWIYKNWQYLQKREGLKIWPFWRGIFGVFWIYPLLKRIHQQSSPDGNVVASFSAGWLATGFIAFSVLERILDRLAHVSACSGLLAFVILMTSVLFLLPAQSHINRLHHTQWPQPQPYPISSGHVICLVVGGLGWLVTILAFLSALHEQ